MFLVSIAPTIVIADLWCISFILFSTAVPLSSQQPYLQPLNNSDHFITSSNLNGSLHSSSTASKKAVAAAIPTIYIPQNYYSDRDRVDEIHNITDVVPFLVDNIISPIIKRVFVDVNAYTLFGVASPSTATPPQPPATAPPKEYVYVTVENEATTTPKATVLASVTEQNENSGRNLLEEHGNRRDVTTASSKYKIRFRERTTSSTSSTRGQYVPNEDDEDESRVFNKIKNL